MTQRECYDKIDELTHEINILKEMVKNYQEITRTLERQTRKSIEMIKREIVTEPFAGNFPEKVQEYYKGRKQMAVYIKIKLESLFGINEVETSKL